MRTFFVAPTSFAIVLALSAVQSSRAEAASDSRQHIESVVETFRKAIINKDEWPAADSKDTMLRWKMESGGINGSKKAVQPRVQA